MNSGKIKKKLFQDLKNIGKTTGRKAIMPHDEIWYLYTHVYIFFGAYVSTLVLILRTMYLLCDIKNKLSYPLEIYLVLNSSECV